MFDTGMILTILDVNLILRVAKVKEALIVNHHQFIDIGLTKLKVNASLQIKESVNTSQLLHLYHLIPAYWLSVAFLVLFF